jgi:septum formation inhibitor MinC
MLERSNSSAIIIEEINDECVLRVGEKILKRSLGTAICAKISEHKIKPGFSKVAIDLRERAFGAEDAEKLKKYIQQHCDIKISHIYSNTSDVSRKSHGGAHELNLSGSFESKKTLYSRANLRCGQVLEYDGSVVLMGNLNAGGRIEAQHSIVVLGEMRGSARAGISNDPDSFIYAGAFRPVKAEIGDVGITYSQIPESLIGGNVICCMNNNEIVLKGNFDETPAKGCVIFA